MKKRFLLLLSFLLLFVVVMPVHAAVLKSGNSLSINQPIQDDAVLSGNSVALNSQVLGDTLIMGSTVTVSATPKRSLIVAGNTITDTAGSIYNAFFFGNTVHLSGHFQRDVYIVAEQVTIDPNTTVDGSVQIAASEITLNGTIKGNVLLHSEQVTSKAAVGGDFGGTISYLEFQGGSVAGNVVYNSDTDAVTPNKAHIVGRLERDTPPFSLGDWIASTLASILFVLFVLLLTPKRTRELAVAVHQNRLRNVIIGLLVIFGAPFLITVLFVTGVGSIVALLILALYVAMICFSAAYTAFIVGVSLLRRLPLALPNQTFATVLAGILGVLFFTVIGLIPYLGSLVVALVGVVVFIWVVGALTYISFTNEYLEV